jgi:hypothetical protein
MGTNFRARPRIIINLSTNGRATLYYYIVVLQYRNLKYYTFETLKYSKYYKDQRTRYVHKIQY